MNGIVVGWIRSVCKNIHHLNGRIIILLQFCRVCNILYTKRRTRYIESVLSGLSRVSVSVGGEGNVEEVWL